MSAYGTGLGRRHLSVIQGGLAQSSAESVATIERVDLTAYDWIVVSTSAGKDSQAMLWAVSNLAREQGVLDRVVAVHCDLGRVEWAGTRELAEEQARLCGVRFEVVSREQGDLLEHVEKRGMWPGPATRYCTSDHKRAQVARVLTKLASETNARLGLKRGARKVQILSCRGERAAESPNRAQLNASVYRDTMASGDKGERRGGVRDVFTWHPILRWSTAEVWTAIRASGLPSHAAYALGMPRLSCCFCVLASRDALLLAGHHNPELLGEYVRVEQKINHTFKADMAIAEIADAVARGERPKGKVTSWGDNGKACGGL